MTQRIDPLGICAAAEAPKPVTARLEIHRTDVCPIHGCGKQMTPILAAKDIPSYICWDHRVVLPQANPETPTL